MAIYSSDGKKLLNVEYDVVPQVGDIIDGMRVLSVDMKTHEEYAVFLLEPNTRITCYVFDEIFILPSLLIFFTLSSCFDLQKITFFDLKFNNLYFSIGLLSSK